MSVEANTYEELTISNVNEKTALLCSAVSEYLLKTWGINYISLTIDGNSYESTEDDRIEEDGDLYHACQNLATAKEIFLKLRSTNDGGADWRLESCFMQYFKDDPGVKENVTYRSSDYYDTNPGVDMYLYNKNGLQRIDYTDTAECVADIKEWYCYTTAIRICDEEQQGNEELHERIMEILAKLCGLLGFDAEALEDRLSDDWEDYGEIVLDGSVRFATKDIPAIVALANQLFEFFKDSDSAEIEFEIYAVPDGKDDYDFASVAIAIEDNRAVDRYCRY